MQIDPDSLPDDPPCLQQMLQELLAENDKLRLLIQRLRATSSAAGPNS